MYDFFINPARLDVMRQHMAALSGDKGLGHFAAAHGLAPATAESWDDWAEFLENYGTAPRSYRVSNGTAIIPVRGSLVSCEIPYWFYYGDTSYEALAATVEHAVANPDVLRVLLQINSPGGAVVGCAAAAARIDAASSGDKPVWSQCAMADSAAYWIAAATNQIIVDPTGEVGSIGVITTHFDMSKMLAEWGITVTHIFAGSHKADGSPYEPLSKSALETIQADIDQLRGLFVAGVSGYRKMNAEDVAKTEALTFIGDRAVAAGLADNTGFLTEVLNTMAVQYSSGIASPTAKKEEQSTMAKKTVSPKTSATKTPKASEDEEETNAAANNAAADEGSDDEGDAPKDDKKKDGGDESDDGDEDMASDASASGERARIDAILNHKEAQGRSALAQHLALKTGMSVDRSIGILTASPKEAKASGNALDAAMEKAGNPRIGAGVPASQSDQANAVLEDMRKRYPTG